MIFENEEKREILPRFRESAYTKIKQEIGEQTPELINEMEKKIEKSAIEALNKRRKVLNFLKR